MSSFPNLSQLSLEAPLVVVPTATYDTPPPKHGVLPEPKPKRALRPEPKPKPKPKPTLVAKLLKHRGSNADAWGKGTDAFLAGPMNFLAVVRYLRDNTTYAHMYKAIQDLSAFAHWDATNLLPNGLVCNEMDDAMDDAGGWLASMVPPRLPVGKGYYTRRDWSNKKVFVLGDFHGSLHSLLDVFLDMVDQGAFKSDGSGLLADDVAVVCLGDLLDRSPYTLECFYLMLRLCRENPDRCVLTAGNHETDKNQWRKKDGTWHEIQNEKKDRCPNGTETFEARMVKVTGALPSSLIAMTSLGTLQFNHGAFEQFIVGNRQTEDFLKFVRFDPTTANALETRGSSGHNPLQWADVAVDPAPPAQGRSTYGAEEIAAYLQTMGLSMLVRGHSDLANLSLLYAKGSEPPQEVQDENAVGPAPPNATYPYYGHPYKDPRPAEQREARGNTFVRKGYDFSKKTLYDMHTLHQAPDADSFDKHLVTEEDGARGLLVVTVASSPFAKPLPPVSMMSSYLAIGL